MKPNKIDCKYCINLEEETCSLGKELTECGTCDTFVNGYIKRILTGE
jgi:hypothetical protein